MLALIGFLMIAVILILLLTQRVNPIIALAGIPFVFALIAGFTIQEVSKFAMSGIGNVVGVVAMFIFAIIFFGVMNDAGMFDPIVSRIVKIAGNNPATITVATTLLAIVAHLDGAGAVTFLITIPAMLPLYERMGMSRLVLATCVALGAGVMNILPWGGPTLRAAATAKMEANDLWVPLIPAQIVGLAGALAIAFFLGLKEKRRLARLSTGDASAQVPESTAHLNNKMELVISDSENKLPVGSPTGSNQDIKRPRLLFVNLALTCLVIIALIAGWLAPAVCFIIGAALALVINYPKVKEQAERINSHAPGAVLMASTLIAAGVLLGVLSESGIVDQMAKAGATLIPHAIAPALPLIVGILGVPLSLLFGPDAYYFGVLPVLLAVGAEFGVDASHIAMASVLGEETAGFPISPLTGSFFLLIGLARVDVGRHILHSLPWLWLLSILMLITAIIIGVIPAWA